MEKAIICKKLGPYLDASRTKSVLINYVFIQPHSPSSICDRTVAGDEGSNGDEIDLNQVPEGWRWVIVQVVR